MRKEPVPLKARLCDEPTAESLINRVAARGPPELGEKVNEIVQLAPAANDEPHVVARW
jgi:hypothetical protein